MMSKPSCWIALFTVTLSACAFADGAHWTYAGHGGPAEWGALSADFATCKFGHAQSPIDIRDAKAADLPAIRFDYKPSPLKIIDNGHTIQVNYAPGSSIDVGGDRYELVQFHFHHPSEEHIAGEGYPMVAHLVHRNAEGRLAVVAVLLDGGGANATIDALWKNIPKRKEHETKVDSVLVDAGQLLPAERGYYTFTGSLTTPPCSEDVRWFVLKAVLPIADAEIATFARLYPFDARPPQPANGRAIEMTR